MPESTRNMMLRLDPGLADRLQAVAEVEGRSVSDVVREAITVLAVLELLDRNGRDVLREPAEELAGLLERPAVDDIREWLSSRMSEEERPTMFERFTDLARQVVRSAQGEARDLHHNYIG